MIYFITNMVKSMTSQRLINDFNTLGAEYHFHLGRECVRMGAAGARTGRCLGHHLLHPQIFTRLAFKLFLS